VEVYLGLAANAKAKIGRFGCAFTPAFGRAVTPSA
jgi:hypothetical protein